jgi:predicted SnoaL-like aldol condensation-catalyzing enzyme
MPIEQNKAIAQRFIEEVWNQGRLEVADELLAPDLITHNADGGVTKGREAFKKFISDSAPPIEAFIFPSMTCLAKAARWPRG